MSEPHWDLPPRVDALLAETAARRPERGIALLDRRGRSDRRSYPALLDAVRQRAGRLAGRGLGPGDVLLVSLETSWEWIECWLGAVHVGALPIATAPAGAMGSGRAHLDKVDGLLERLGARFLVAGPAIASEAAELGLTRITDRHLTPEALDAGPAGAVDDRRGDSAPAGNPSDLAFLQLTSGSTGFPRGVCIPHASAVHNVGAICTAMGLTPETLDDFRGVSWLPLHHDMGLVGCLLVCIAFGLELELIPPRHFLARPETWLAAVGRRRGVISPAPNFAYQACIERGTAGRIEGADLSGWTVGLTGAEMVRPETVHTFCAEHAALGFDPRAIRPCYGLAEGTLAVTVDQRREGLRTAAVPGDASGSEVACVGAPVADTRVRITDDLGRDLPDHTIGQIRVAGPGVFAGYYRDPEASAESLVDGELVTGDLGFVKDGELYITGRTKDLLIIRGTNLMPHELEWCAEKAIGGGGVLRAGAFSVDGGSEGEVAVVVAETNSTEPPAIAELERDVRVGIGRELGLTLHDVVLVRRGRIPRTSSGKVQRGELRRRYLAGEIERVGDP